MEYRFTEENFEAEVLKSDIPVLVDFYADWCGPCKMMMPVVEKMAEKYDGKAKVGKVNSDENSALAAKYNIMSIPSFLVDLLINLFTYYYMKREQQPYRLLLSFFTPKGPIF